MKVKQFEITVKQFEVLNDILWEIEGYRDYEGEDDEDKIALDQLQDMFSYDKYIAFSEQEGVE